MGATKHLAKKLRLIAARKRRGAPRWADLKKYWKRARSRRVEAPKKKYWRSSKLQL